MVRAACFIAMMLCAVHALTPAPAAEYPHPRNIGISGAWAQLSAVREGSAVAHITVTNRAMKTDRLESALSPVARLVELQAEPTTTGDPSVIAPEALATCASR